MNKKLITIGVFAIVLACRLAVTIGTKFDELTQRT